MRTRTPMFFIAIAIACSGRMAADSSPDGVASNVGGQSSGGSGDTSMAKAVDGPMEPTGVALECPFDEGLSYARDVAYPFCQWDGVFPDGLPVRAGAPAAEPVAWEKYCRQLVNGGWGFFNWHAAGDDSGLCDNDASCNACDCSVACDQNTPSGCPEGETGDATPTCFNAQREVAGGGDCFLTCDLGEQCPDGMECVPMPELERQVCAWLTTGDRCSDEQLMSAP